MSVSLNIQGFIRPFSFVINSKRNSSCYAVTRRDEGIAIDVSFMPLRDVSRLSGRLSERTVGIRLSGGRRERPGKKLMHRRNFTCPISHIDSSRRHLQSTVPLFTPFLPSFLSPLHLETRIHTHDLNTHTHALTHSQTTLDRR